MSNEKQSANTNPHVGHRARLRARFRESGLTGFAPHETLELLLTYCIPRVNTNEIAHELLNRFGSLSRVIDASAEELCSVRGIGEEAATFFNLLSLIRRQCALDECDVEEPFDTVQRVSAYLSALYIGANKERVTMLMFDNGMHLLNSISLGEGTVNCTPITQRRVLEEAFKSDASGVVLAHNHPHGISVPSGNDIAVTETLEHTLRTMGVTLIEHFILTETDCAPMMRNRHYSVVPNSGIQKDMCFYATFYGEPLEVWMHTDPSFDPDLDPTWHG